MKKRVLITGATGFVGFHLIEAALTADLEVYASKRQSSNVEHLKDLDVNFVELDFESIYALTKAIDLNKYHYVIHAAGATKAGNLDQYNKYNAYYTRNLAIAASRAVHQIDKFIFLSSLAAIGPSQNVDELLKDDSEYHPVTDYGKSKALAEAYLRNMEHLPLIIFRPTAVYGPRERELLKLLKSINRGLEIYVGHETQRLSFLYVKDLAQIIINALKSELENKSYNISDGNVYGRASFSEQARTVLRRTTVKVKLPLTVVRSVAWSLENAYKLIGRIPTLNSDKVNELSGMNWACEIENIKKDLGFRPAYPLQQGLSETIAWYQLNKWL